MPRKATKDTWGTENIAGVEVRRKVMAGDIIPAHIDLKDDEFEEVQGGETQIGEPAPATEESPQQAEQPAPPQPASSRAKK